ncbi:Plastid-targeted protein 3 [Heracleum sosnowskyi]|uniref:Plastid-targeted protein 3 n=1 Tax=Heracleum sosnowskyi TaxID=360622 RepID=A0AAD8JLN2_9APIA|nr:Plastid-targeted protein 3 [Heracleum sosnowskyi]
MSITQSIACNFSSKTRTPLPRFQTSLYNPIFEIRTRRHGDKSSCSTTTRSIQYSPWQHDTKVKRNFVVCSSSVPPDQPAASSGGLPGGIPGSWKSWLLGIVVTIIIPLMTNKWGALLKWTEKLESAVQTVEDMVEEVEEIAEKVDKFAESISDDLPEGKLKETLERIEHVAERVAKDADQLDNMIDKVQEAEDKLEAYIEEQRNSAAKKNKDGKKN